MKQFNQKMKFVFSFFQAKRFIFFPIVALFAFNLNAVEIKFICYQDSNECDVIAKAATEWEASSGHSLNIETVPT